jgi:hypothetical protein
VNRYLQSELKNRVKHSLHRGPRFKIQDQLVRHIHLAISNLVAEGAHSDWLEGFTRMLWVPDLDDPALQRVLGPHDALWLSYPT